MQSLVLFMFTLVQTPAFAGSSTLTSLIANTRSPGARGAIVYSANAARITAEAIKRPSQLSQDKIDDFQFYTVFCAYGAYRHLDKSIFGSWEFADRIENLLADWPQADPQVIEEVRQAAGRARMGTKVKYEAPPLPESIPWLESLSDGDEVKIEKFDIELSGVLKGLFDAGIKTVAVKWERDGSKIDWPSGDDVLIQDKLVTTGTLHSGKTRSQFWRVTLDDHVLMENYETRRQGRRTVIEKDEGVLPFLIIPYNLVTALKLVSDLSPRTVKKRLLDGLKANGYSFRDLQKAAARTKGIRPTCETGVE